MNRVFHGWMKEVGDDNIMNGIKHIVVVIVFGGVVVKNIAHTRRTIAKRGRGSGISVQSVGDPFTTRILVRKVKKEKEKYL